MSALLQSGAVGWGVIGCGWVARDHAIPAILTAPSAHLVAVCDPNAEALSQAPEGAQRHKDLPAMLADPAVEAVYIATPNHLHTEQTIAAAKAGKAILCEKPMATTVAEAERMVAATESAGILYATAYDQRHHAAHRRLGELIAEGRLGRLTQIRLHYACWLPPGWSGDNWRVDPARAGGGAAIDLAPHGIDLISHLLGEEPCQLRATLQRAVHSYPVDDGALLTAEFPSGCLASLHVGYNCPDALPRRRLELIGTHAMALAQNTMGQTAGGTLTLIDAQTGAYEPIPFDTLADPFAEQVERFSQAVAGVDDFPFPARRDLALTALLLEALDAATPKEASHAA
ncbi:MAG: Gfo/Idh/MocA family oxidoreductase [Pseudomonadota bacterium]